MEFNYLAVFVAALVPLIIGFVWYNPKTFGTVWMKHAEMTEQKMQSANMLKIFGVTLILSFVLAFILPSITVHQMGAFSLVQGDLGIQPSYETFMAEYKDEFRTFKHGAFHGVIAGLFIVLPILGINALFERKSWKYILINVGYWTVTLAIMGAIVCGWR